MADLAGELAELLRDMRHQAGYTQGALGRRLGMLERATARVSDYENGRASPTLELIGRWAAACGYTAELVMYSADGHTDLYKGILLNTDPQ